MDMTFQGGNEVCFFIADPICVRKFQTRDQFSSLIPQTWYSLIPDP